MDRYCGRGGLAAKQILLGFAYPELNLAPRENYSAGAASYRQHLSQHHGRARFRKLPFS